LNEVGTEGIPQGPQWFGPRKIVDRQRRHGDQFAQRRDRFSQLPEKVSV
jgi:hypothetical protein